MKMKKAFYIAAVHIAIILGVVLFGVFIGCPIKRIFSIPCPSCGLTRAHISALSLDFKSAFYFHPLFFVPIPLIFYFAHKRFFKFKIKKWVEYTVLTVFAVLYIAVYLYRLLILKPDFLF